MGIHLIRLIAFVLLIFTSACASEKEAPSPSQKNNPQQLENRQADEEDEKDGEDDDNDEKDEKD